jgi:hypothetical protein
MSSGCFYADAQSLMQTAKKAEQSAKELKQQEASRYNSIVDSKDLTKYNQYIADYPRGKNTPEIKRRADELKIWQNAKTSNTVSAYESYISSSQYHWYDSEANNAIKRLKQAAEKLAWNRVLTANNVETYQQYLRDNPNSGYKIEAEKAINRLKGSSAWNSIKGTKDIETLRRFISEYPNAHEVSDASNRLHELKGCQYYNNGELKSAYSEFSQVSRKDIAYESFAAYDAAMEYNEFSKLGTNSSEASLISFLIQYPNSIYASRVSNMVAVAKAGKFGDYSTSYDYNQAMSYAKDSHTQRLVQLYIAANKDKQKEKKHLRKSLERKRNGGTLNFGLDFMNIGYSSVSEGGSIGYYDIGLLLRIGNYRDRIQFAFGLRPGIILYDDGYYDDSYETEEMQRGFHMPIIGQLKLNLFNISEKSRLFVYGQYQYNAVRLDDKESEMAWSAGIGLAWKHIDWSFYYRQDIGRPSNWDYDKLHYYGMSLIYYWQL